MEFVNDHSRLAAGEKSSRRQVYQSHILTLSLTRICLYKFNAFQLQL